MIVTLHTQRLHTLAQVRAFVAGSEPLSFTLTDRQAAYGSLPPLRGGMADTLRQFGYISKRGSFDKTRPTKINIGERRKPYPDGRPGYLRVDSVHQGDLGGCVQGFWRVGASCAASSQA